MIVVRDMSSKRGPHTHTHTHLGFSWLRAPIEAIVTMSPWSVGGSIWSSQKLKGNKSFKCLYLNWRIKFGFSLFINVSLSIALFFLNFFWHCQFLFLSLSLSPVLYVYCYSATKNSIFPSNWIAFKHQDMNLHFIFDLDLFLMSTWTEKQVQKSMNISSLHLII